MSEKEIRFIDLFGGVGGFRAGLESASSSFKCVAYYEIDKYAVQTYNKNFGENHEPTDITKVKSADIPDHDLICAGFPCQSFSVAGKRRGFQDTRGTLFFEIARIARDKRPGTLLLENVKGLLSHDKGATFGTILQTLDELGYDAEWQVLNSKDWGVPQNRERVFIIGHLRGTGGWEILPILKSGKEFNTAPREARDAGARLFNYPANTISQRDYKGGNQVILQEPTRTPKGGGHLPLVRACLTPDRPERRQNGRRFKEDGEDMFTLTEASPDDWISIYEKEVELLEALDKHCETCKCNEEGHKIIHKNPESDDVHCETCTCNEGVKTFTVSSSGRGCIEKGRIDKRAQYSDVSQTLTAMQDTKRSGTYVMNTLTEATGNQIRRLTPTECERLQGFPDDWTKGVSDTQRYKQMGNAVTVNVIEMIGRELVKPKRGESK